MKRFTDKDFASIENYVYSVGIELSIISSLVKFLDIASNEQLDISSMDISNLIVLLRQKLNDINEKYDNIECLLDI